MRILHTSDWHIGRTFHGMNTVPHFLEYADFLIETIKSSSADVLLVSGDVFDRAVPPLDALEAYETTMARVLDTGAVAVLTSGNHDSHQRLGVGRRLMESSGLYIRTSLSDIERPVVLGDDGDRTVVYGIPYLEPALVSGVFDTSRTHSAVLNAAIGRILAHRAQHCPDHTAIVMAHGFIAGAEPSDSERSIEIGGVGRAEADLFTWADYAALGHLHRPQTVAPNVRYSGSPLPYSFSEAGTNKLMWLYDTRSGAIDSVTIPEILPIASLTGSVDQLLVKAPVYQDHAVEVRLTNTTVPQGALDSLRKAFPQLLSVQWINLVQTTAPRGRKKETIDDAEVFAQFCRAAAGRPPSESERELFANAMQWAQERTR
ncbi:exonuclease subunit SbcD [Brevibacterium sp. HMSC08F02]|uniref:metallophosphoesterase family protein n=1 Tax=Brevibacterium sp. HMSC08F02 TaxID=1581140 RepID=UPI0008A11B69|nr:exonuclease subunit SbcD [Brevibacterium sp. HMSC08F02]